jgi:hypothetical protein
MPAHANKFRFYTAVLQPSKRRGNEQDASVSGGKFEQLVDEADLTSNINFVHPPLSTHRARPFRIIFHRLAGAFLLFLVSGIAEL